MFFEIFNPIAHRKTKIYTILAFLSAVGLMLTTVQIQRLITGDLFIRSYAGFV